MSKTALISGIRGQDGSYLADLLLQKNIKVVGLTRDPGLLFRGNIAHLEDKVTLEYSSYDYRSLTEIVLRQKPHYIFNMTVQPYVLKSWQMLDETIQASGIIPCHFLKVIQEIDPKIKFFQASSSEIFGPDRGAGLDEASSILPRTPYGCAKALAHNMVVSFRENYDMFAVNGILFNHESSRRSDNFLSKKVIQSAIKIKNGHLQSLELGNLHVQRDWGFAPEYMEAVVKMMECERPEDFVIASGTTHSVEEMVREVFEYLDLDYKKYLQVNPELVREFEPDFCRGIPDKARELLGWKAKTSFKDMLQAMTKVELEKNDA